MENIFTILFVFGLILVITVLFLYRKDKKRILPLTEQIYQDGKLSVSVVKEKRKAKLIIIEMLFTKKGVKLQDVFIELGAEDKTKKNVSLKPLFSGNPDTEVVDKPGEFYVKVPYTAVEEILSVVEFPAVSMKFAVESSDGKKYKSHLLSISERWGLLRMDSGIYN